MLSCIGEFEFLRCVGERYFGDTSCGFLQFLSLLYSDSLRSLICVNKSIDGLLVASEFLVLKISLDFLMQTVAGQESIKDIKFIPKSTSVKDHGFRVISEGVGINLSKQGQTIIVGKSAFKSSKRILATEDHLFTVEDGIIEQFDVAWHLLDGDVEFNQISKLQNPTSSKNIEFDLITSTKNGLYFSLGNEIYLLENLETEPRQIGTLPQNVGILNGSNSTLFLIPEFDSSLDSLAIDVYAYDCESEKLYQFDDLLFVEQGASTTEIIICGLKSDSLVGVIGYQNDFLYFGTNEDGDIVNIELQEDSSTIYIKDFCTNISVINNLLLVNDNYFEIHGAELEPWGLNEAVLENADKAFSILDDAEYEFVEDPSSIINANSSEAESTSFAKIAVESDGNKSELFGDESAIPHDEDTLELNDLEKDSSKMLGESFDDSNVEQITESATTKFSNTETKDENAEDLHSSPKKPTNAAESPDNSLAANVDDTLKLEDLEQQEDIPKVEEKDNTKSQKAITLEKEKTSGLSSGATTKYEKGINSAHEKQKPSAVVGETPSFSFMGSNVAKVSLESGTIVKDSKPESLFASTSNSFGGFSSKPTTTAGDDIPKSGFGTSGNVSTSTFKSPFVKTETSGPQVSGSPFAKANSNSLSGNTSGSAFGSSPFAASSNPNPFGGSPFAASSSPNPFGATPFAASKPPTPFGASSTTDQDSTTNSSIQTAAPKFSFTNSTPKTGNNSFSKPLPDFGGGAAFGGEKSKESDTDDEQEKAFDDFLNTPAKNISKGANNGSIANSKSTTTKPKVTSESSSSESSEEESEDEADVSSEDVNVGDLLSVAITARENAALALDTGSNTVPAVGFGTSFKNGNNIPLDKGITSQIIPPASAKTNTPTTAFIPAVNFGPISSNAFGGSFTNIPKPGPSAIVLQNSFSKDKATEVVAKETEPPTQRAVVSNEVTPLSTFNFLFLTVEKELLEVFISNQIKQNMQRMSENHDELSKSIAKESHNTSMKTESLSKKGKNLKLQCETNIQIVSSTALLSEDGIDLTDF